MIYHDYWTIKQEDFRFHSTKIKNLNKFVKKGRSLPKGMFFCKKEILLAMFPPPNNMSFEDFWINFVCLTNNNTFYLNHPIYFYRQRQELLWEQ